MFIRELRQSSNENPLSAGVPFAIFRELRQSSNKTTFSTRIKLALFRDCCVSTRFVRLCRDLIEEGTMPPACRLNAKQTEDKETLLRLESEAVLLAHTGMLMSPEVLR